MCFSCSPLIIFQKIEVKTDEIENEFRKLDKRYYFQKWHLFRFQFGHEFIEHHTLYYYIVYFILCFFLNLKLYIMDINSRSSNQISVYGISAL